MSKKIKLPDSVYQYIITKKVQQITTQQQLADMFGISKYIVGKIQRANGYFNGKLSEAAINTVPDELVTVWYENK